MKNFFILVLFVTLVSSSLANTIFDVVHYGAIGDGIVDDTQAFLNAFKAACNSSSSSVTMHIPSGKTFLLGPSVFQGQCNPDVHVTIDGSIVAPEHINQWRQCSGKICEEWIKFSHIDSLFINGSGTISGRGLNWWECDGCQIIPTTIQIAHSMNVEISGIRFVNSPSKNLMIYASAAVHISQVQVQAPHDVAVTGIDMSGSDIVDIDNVQIRTGGDCVSIGSNSSQITIANITCGPGGGNGISINLGEDGNYATVEKVLVSSAYLKGTRNGLAINTWQGGRGSIRSVTFQDISVSGSSNAIIIDQQNLVQTSCGREAPETAVKINGVKYKNVHGTSLKETAVSFECSEAVPCTNIMLTNVDLTSTNNNGETKSVCNNAHGVSSGQVVPAVHCLVQS